MSLDPTAKNAIYGGLQKQICAIAQRTCVLYFYRNKITVREREELQKNYAEGKPERTVFCREGS